MGATVYKSPNHRGSFLYNATFIRHDESSRSDSVPQADVEMVPAVDYSQGESHT